MSSNWFEGSPRRERRSGTFSLSAAFRSSPKRASVIEPLISPDLPDLLPTCLEKDNYPLYDPQNPHHNPSAVATVQQSPSRRRRESQTSFSESQRQGSWLEEFPRRSIHKARSGLLAIRASLLRLSSREGTDLTETVIEEVPPEFPKHERDSARRPGLSSTTQEDLSFGIGLYRTTSTPWIRVSDGAGADSLPRVESPLSLVNVNSAPAELESHYYTSDDPEPISNQPVSMMLEEPPPYYSIEQRARYHRLSKDSREREDTNGQLGADTSSETYGCLTSSGPSTEWDELGSPASSFRFEDMIPSQKISISTGVSSRASTQPEAFSSEEHLPLHLVSPKTNTWKDKNSMPAPNSSSAVVTFAFPGVFQALLDQWAADTKRKVKNTSYIANGPTYNSLVVAQARQASDGGEPNPSRELHSFGLHMSLRTEQDLDARPHAASEQSPLDSEEHPFELQSPTGSGNPFSLLGRSRVIGSSYDSSEYSTNYTFQSSPSANVTSRTSVSNDIWSPLESPIDEEVLFGSFFRNEYYMADGKTSGFDPSQDNQPVKAEGRFFGDGSMHSGRGLDRTYSERLRELTERIPPMSFSRSIQSGSAQPDPRTGREESQSTDDDTVIHHHIYGRPRLD